MHAKFARRFDLLHRCGLYLYVPISNFVICSFINLLTCLNHRSQPAQRSSILTRFSQFRLKHWLISISSHFYSFLKPCSSDLIWFTGILMYSYRVCRRFELIQTLSNCPPLWSSSSMRTPIASVSCLTCSTFMACLLLAARRAGWLLICFHCFITHLDRERSVFFQE